MLLDSKILTRNEEDFKHVTGLRVVKPVCLCVIS